MLSIARGRSGYYTPDGIAIGSGIFVACLCVASVEADVSEQLIPIYQQYIGAGRCSIKVVHSSLAG
jgi:hypothetical protein